MNPNETDHMKKKMKKWDEDALPCDDLFLDRLHNKIMAKVEMAQIQPPPPPLQFHQKIQKKVYGFLMYKPWREIIISRQMFSILCLIFVLAILAPETSFYKKWERSSVSETRILTEAVMNPDIIQNIASYQSDIDFFVDLADASMNDLKDEDLQALFKHKTEKTVTR